MTTIEFRPLSSKPAEIEAVQKVLNQAPDYSIRVSGRPPTGTEAWTLYNDLPPGRNQDDLFIFGLFLDGEMAGCAGGVRGYPDPQTAYLGLLLISEQQQRKRLGQIFYQEAEKHILKWASIEKIRLAVLESNAVVFPFWAKMGFSRTGDRRPYKDENVETVAVIMEKRLRG